MEKVKPFEPILDPETRQQLWPGLDLETLRTPEEVVAKRKDLGDMHRNWIKKWAIRIGLSPYNKQETVADDFVRYLKTLKNMVVQRDEKMEEREEWLRRPPNVVEFRKPDPLGIREARALDLMAMTEYAPLSNRPEPHVVLATNTVCWCTHDRRTHFKARLCEKWMVNKNSGWNNELKELVKEGYILRHYPGEVSGTTRPDKPPGSQLYFSFTQKARDLWKKHERKQA